MNSTIKQGPKEDFPDAFVFITAHTAHEDGSMIKRRASPNLHGSKFSYIWF